MSRASAMPAGRRSAADLVSLLDRFVARPAMTIAILTGHDGREVQALLADRIERLELDNPRPLPLHGLLRLVEAVEAATVRSDLSGRIGSAEEQAGPGGTADRLERRLVRAVDRPLAVIVEDAGLLDRESCRALDRLAGRAAVGGGGPPLLLLCLCGRGDGPPPFEALDGVVRLEAPRLSGRELAGLLIRDGLLDRLSAAAGGDERLLRELLETAAAGAGEVLALPYRTLPDESRRLLRLLAADLCHLLRVDDLLMLAPGSRAALDRFVAAGAVAPDGGGFVIRHRGLRLAAVREAGPDERVEVWRRLAGRPEMSPAAAHLYARAAGLRTEAFEAAVRAAGEAFEGGQFESACALYAWIADHPDGGRLDDPVSLQYRAVVSALALPDRPALLRFARLFVETAGPGDAGRAEVVLVAVADAAAGCGRADADDLIRLAGGRGVVPEARLEAVRELLLAEAAYAAGRYAETVDGLTPTDGPAGLRLDLVRGRCLLMLGRLEEAERLFEQVAEAAAGRPERQVDLVRAVLNRGIARYRAGDTAGAGRYYEQARAAASGGGLTREWLLACANLAILHHREGRLRPAIDLYESSARLLGERRDLARLAPVLNNLAGLYRTVGDTARARELVRRVDRLLESVPSERTRAYNRIVSGQLLLAEGDPAAARAELLAGLEAFESIGDGRAALFARFHLVECEARLSSGDPGRWLPKLSGEAAGSDDAEIGLMGALAAGLAGGDAAEVESRLNLFEPARNLELAVTARLWLAGKRLDAGDRDGAELEVLRARRLIDEAAAQLTAPLADRLREAAWHLPRRRLIEHRLASMKPPSVPGLPTPSVVLIGRSRALAEALALAKRLAPSTIPVVISGETGTGKELFARELHRLSGRSGPFVPVNCAALAEGVLVSELFGHERGAFTGATARHRGRFELADGGTLLLDEAGDIPPAVQTRLLRFLQDGAFERVGGSGEIRVDVRVVCATNRDLARLAREGRFREDLLYRLRGAEIRVPPLRERPEDIPPLVEHFLARHAAGRPVRIEAEALERMMMRDWPGNVRELEHLVHRGVVLAEGGRFNLPDDRPAAGPPPGYESGLDRLLGAGMSLAELKASLERRCIEEAMARTGGNITQAAELLGMTRARLSQIVNQRLRGGER